MTQLSLCLLGSFTAKLDGQPVRGFDSNKVRALLAYLVVEASHPHRRDSLATLLWPESPQHSARTNLRNALANLRKVLRDDNPEQPFILVTRDTLQFNRKSRAEIDVSGFNALTNIENPTLQQLENAVAVYQGNLLQGFSLKDCLAFDDWTLIIRERLHRTALSALRDLSAHYAQQGHYTKACRFSRRQVEMEPWREEAHRDLMRLLAHSGQRSEALTQYETCRQVLDAELGVTPSRETKTLYKQIRDEQLEDLAKPVTAQPSVMPSPGHNLPLQLTQFVGRQAEMAAIGERLSDPACRLLTLIGPGGSGKTRLAIEAGLEWVDRFEHGVFLVSLAPLQSTDSLISALANSLNYTFYEGVAPRQQVLNYLQNKNMLLIFDNFEHLLSPFDNPQEERSEDGNVTTLVLDILRSAPDVKILVTSRVRMNVQSEVMFPVSGMAVPESILEVATDPTMKEVTDVTQYSAVELFMLSAKRTNPTFELTVSNQNGVVRICQLVKGLPLGILLAAGWVRMLSPADIAAQIQQNFDFLETDLRDIPKRQRSLRAVFNHSWGLLSTRECEILQALTVFRGLTSQTAILAVTGATLRELRSLVDKSQLMCNADGYYEMHELVRQYAAEKLDQFPDAGEIVRDRHSAYYIAALAQWCEAIKGPEQEITLFKMYIELANIRQAWMWALDQKRLHKLDQASYTLTYFFMNYRLLHIGEQWFRLSVKRLEGHFDLHNIDEYVYSNPGGLRVYALILGYYVYVDFWSSGLSDRTRKNIEKGNSILNVLESANFDIRQDRTDFIYSTVDACEGPKLEMKIQSLEINTALGNRWGIAWALWDLVWTYWMTGYYDEAKQAGQQGLGIARDLGAPRLIIVLLKALGYLAMESGEYKLAQQFCEEELQCRQKLLKNAGMENVYESLALISLYQGHLSKAKNYANTVIKISQEMNYTFHKEVGLRRLGLVHMASGHYEQAQKVFSESLDITREIGNRYETSSSSVRLAESKLYGGYYIPSFNLVHESLKLASHISAKRNISFCYLVLGRLAFVHAEYAEAQKQIQKGIEILESMAPRRELGPAYADLCLTSMRMGKPAEAKQHLKTSLDYAVKTGDFVAHVHALPIAALFFDNQGLKEKATNLYTLASRYPMVANSRWFSDIVSKHFPKVEALTPQVFKWEDQDESISTIHTTVKDILAGIG